MTKRTAVKNKNMTLDGLAKMITEGREETNDLARRMAKGFESIDKRFAEVNKEIADGREETSELARRMAKGFENVDKRFAETKKEIADGREETSELARMVAKGFLRVDKEFAEVKKDVIEVKDNLASTRGDILAMGDRFTLKMENLCIR